MSWRWAIAAFVCLSGCDGADPLTALEGRGRSLSGPVSPPPVHDLIQEHAEELGIRPSQVRAIRRLADDARTTLDRYHDDIDAARTDLRGLLDVDRPDRAAVRKAIRALGEAETKLREGEIGVMLDIFAELEPDQRRALGRKAQQRRRPHRRGPTPAPPERRRSKSRERP